MLVLLANSFLNFGPLQIFVPFTAEYEPFWTGVGVLAMYLLVIVVITTTVVRRQLHNLVWYGLHLLSYPAFVFATAHGIASGHDTHQPWMLALYVLCTAVAALLVAIRFTRLAGAGDDDFRRWGPGVLAGGAFSAMVIVLIASRIV